MESTYRLPPPPAVVELLAASQGESGIEHRVVHGISHNSVRLGVEALREIQALRSYSSIPGPPPVQRWGGGSPPLSGFYTGLAGQLRHVKERLALTDTSAGAPASYRYRRLNTRERMRSYRRQGVKVGEGFGGVHRSHVWGVSSTRSWKRKEKGETAR